VKRKLTVKKKKNPNSNSVSSIGSEVATQQPDVDHKVAESTDHTSVNAGQVNSKDFEVILVPFIPEAMRGRILRIFHDSPTAGHLGVKKTRQRMIHRVFLENYV